MNTAASERAAEIAGEFFTRKIDPNDDSEPFCSVWGPSEGKWSDSETKWSAEESLEAWIELFRHFEVYARPYPFAMVDQGLWAIGTAGGVLGEIFDAIRSRSNFDLGCELLAAMPRMYTEYLIEARDEPELAFHMWWDLLKCDAARLRRGRARRGWRHDRSRRASRGLGGDPRLGRRPLPVLRTPRPRTP